MSGRRGRRPGDPEITRRAILDAARGAFSEHGYEKATIRSIAEAAGVDVLYARGRHMAALLEALSPAITGFAISENAGIAQKLAQDLRPGDMVLIKGSRAARLDEVVSALTNAGATDGVSGWGRPREAA